MATIGQFRQASQRFRILIIDDNPSDGELLRQFLSASDGCRFEVEHVERLSHALERLQDDHFDVALLDLTLPDSQGLDTVTRALAEAPHIPFVVLTGNDDEGMALAAVQRGAQDYLVKGRVSSEALVRSIRYAVQRHRIRQGVKEAKKDYETGRFRPIEKQSPAPAVPPETPGFGTRRLSDTQILDVVKGFSNALEAAAAPSDVTSPAAVSSSLWRLARRLGQLQAGPQDVMDVHDAGLRAKTSNATEAGRRNYESLSARLALELMGHLAAYYRELSGGRPG
jgi:DNA-binding NarL/FixJ family response regulator